MTAHFGVCFIVRRMLRRGAGEAADMVTRRISMWSGTKWVSLANASAERQLLNNGEVSFSSPFQCWTKRHMSALRATSVHGRQEVDVLCRLSARAHDVRGRRGRRQVPLRCFAGLLLCGIESVVSNKPGLMRPGLIGRRRIAHRAHPAPEFALSGRAGCPADDVGIFRILADAIPFGPAVGADVICDRFEDLLLKQRRHRRVRSLLRLLCHGAPSPLWLTGLVDLVAAREGWRHDGGRPPEESRFPGLRRVWLALRSPPPSSPSSSSRSRTHVLSVRRRLAHRSHSAELAGSLPACSAGEKFEKSFSEIRKSIFARPEFIFRDFCKLPAPQLEARHWGHGDLSQCQPTLDPLAPETTPKRHRDMPEGRGKVAQKSPRTPEKTGEKNDNI